MTLQTINVGTSANDGTGDTVRTSFQKTNANFSDLTTNLGEVVGEVNAKWEGAVGNGVIDDTVALQAMFDLSRDTGKPWVIPAGDYLVTAAVTAYTSGRCFGRLVAANTSQVWYVFQVMPVTADMVDIPLATVNAWTGLVHDNTLSADFASYVGNTIGLYSTDEKIITRRNATGLAYQETIVVDDASGAFYPPITTTKTATWTATSVIRAIRNRSQVVIDGLKVAYTSGSGEAVGGVLIQRPNTVLRSSSVVNVSSGKVMQGFQVSFASGVSIIDGYVEGLKENTTNYGYNIGMSVGTVLINCREIDCRRGVDNHASKQARVIMGDYPDGVGAHWVDGLEVYGAYIASDPSNTAAIHVAGRNINVHHNRIVMRSDQFSCLNVRDDLFELDGSIRLDDNDIDINCSASASTNRVLVNISAGTSAEHDYGRQLRLPTAIYIRGNRVHQISAGFTGNLYLVSMLAVGSTTNPSGILAGGSIFISDNVFSLDAGILNSGHPRLRIAINKVTAYSAGSGYIIRVEGLPSCLFYLWCDPSHANPSGLRHTVVSRDVGLLTWQGGYGAFLSADLQRTTALNVFGTLRPSAGYATPIGDEIEVGRDILDLSRGLGIAEDATTARTFSLADAGKTVRFTSSSAVTVTVPPNSTVAFPVGTLLNVRQAGTGQVTIAPGAGVTLNTRPGLLLGGQYAAAMLEKVSADVWDLSGDLTT